MPVSSPDEVDCLATNRYAAASGSSANPSSSVLIIEDALIHSNIIGRIASKAGFTVTSTRSYEEACKSLSMWQFDCITLDLGLGAHGGLDVLRYLSTIHCEAQIIIVSQSDRETCDDMVQLGRALDLNVSLFLQKPLDLVLLRDTLEGMRTQSVLQKLGPSTI